MIVIPRKNGESVVIGDDIILTVIEVRGDKVRLGVEHPKGVTVHRWEVVRGDTRSKGACAGIVADVPCMALALE